MEREDNIFIVGTRGSVLALAQTNMLLEQIKSVNPGIIFQIKTIKTSGDLGLIQEIGAFVKEVENALIQGEIDLAVHSYKDMPTSQPKGLDVACVPLRGEHRDCLITKHNTSLMDLPMGAKIGTSSQRRAFQLNKLRPDIQVVPIHGNIITRMGKVESGELDAVILAFAGLQRVNMPERAGYIFENSEILPAVAQGALAIEIREDDKRTRNIIAKIHDRNTEKAVTAERAFLKALGGGCRMPMAAFAHCEENNILMEGLYCSEDGSRIDRITGIGDIAHPSILGENLAAELLAKF
jgi:hydroxymethylbilane synthase